MSNGLTTITETAVGAASVVAAGVVVGAALGAISGAPSASTLGQIQKSQFAADPGSQKDLSTDPDSPTFYRNPHANPLLLRMQDAKSKADATATSGVGGSIFFRRQGGFYASGSLGVVDFDLIIDEETTYRAQVCQHPVQSGDPITDHIQALPPTGRLKVLISNYSLKYANGGTKTWDESQNRALLAYETLKGLMRSRSEVALVTTLEDFSTTNNQVVLTQLTTPKSAETGDALVFDITYTQIYKVSKLKTTTASVRARPADMETSKNRQAAPKITAGKQSPHAEDVPSTGYLSTGDE